ncbi:family 1 glycosylhydrolase [Streptantibioticus parmotrematis]|uniref:glycoside hydrolase family 1 protein n=1 Tax=Streptantibioticus parmotrematis TaxID=2873249 RepID=UPI0033C6EC28
MPASSGPGFALPPGFLMGASTSAHQVEGNNVSSDWWAMENRPGSPVAERSGDAADSFHRWPQDMDLLAQLGFNAYRFGIEWARIEPERGHVSKAALAHYREMVRGALQRGLTPVVTLHHFTSPRWFTELGGWRAPEAVDLFTSYVGTACEVLAEGVRYVATINEPNMVALFYAMLGGGGTTPDGGGIATADGSGGGEGEGGDAVQDSAQAGRADAQEGAAAGFSTHTVPDQEVTRTLIRAHRAAFARLKAADPRYQVGWTVANQAYQPLPGAERLAAEHARPREDVFLEAAREDDWVGVQSYTRNLVGTDGPLPVPEGAVTTQTGWEFYPEALGQAVRHTARVVGAGVPVLVTENGIATDDDRQRVAYTTRALAGLAAALRDGVDVRGYLHWSALDNYEWGSYRPRFGLVAVDPGTFARTPKESARWLGGLARAGRIPDGEGAPPADPTATAASGARR